MSAHKAVSGWLAALAAEARGSWRELHCPPPDRFWKVAEGLDEWGADEEEHVHTCTRCRAYSRRIAAVTRAPAGGWRGWVCLFARQPVGRFRAAASFSDREAFAEQRLAFDGDAHLVGVLYLRTRRGRPPEHWLHLEHDRLPPGTMLEVSVKETAAA